MSGGADRGPALASACMGVVGAFGLGLVLTWPAAAQESNAGNRANWALYEQFSSEELSRFIHSTVVPPNWINETDSLWYLWEDRNGKRFNLMIPSGPTKRPLFDHQLMAEALSQELGRYFESHDLPIEDLEFCEGGERIEFTAEGERFRFDLNTQRLDRAPARVDRPRQWRRFSPDSTAYVYAEAHNLYFVEVIDGVDQEAIQLSTDGEENYSFGRREVDETRRDFATASICGWIRRRRGPHEPIWERGFLRR